VQSFHSDHKVVPPTRWRGDSPTWFALILPHIGEDGFYQHWKLDELYYSGNNQRAREANISLYRCPSRGTDVDLVSENHGTAGPALTTLGAPGDYAGNGGTMRDPPNIPPYNAPRFWRPERSGPGGGYCAVRPGGEPDLNGVIMASSTYCNTPAPPNWSSDMSFDRIPDGLSKTFLAGEKHVNFGTLEKQGSLYNGDNGGNAGRGAGIELPLARTSTDTTYCVDMQSGACKRCSCDNFGSWHNGTVQFVFTDGHVESLSALINPGALGNFASRNDGR
jgi:prepilin-type processing-associated H-X9-DG protein